MNLPGFDTAASTERGAQEMTRAGAVTHELV